LFERGRSKRLPLTDRVALAAKGRLRDAVSSPRKNGERKKQGLRAYGLTPESRSRAAKNLRHTESYR